jgi:hypothetical protein
VHTAPFRPEVSVLHMTARRNIILVAAVLAARWARAKPEHGLLPEDQGWVRT